MPIVRICRGLLTAIILLFTRSAFPAEISGNNATDGSALISISGKVVRGDADNFERLAAAITDTAIVRLDSPGGDVIDALTIGEAIRTYHFSTAVPNGATCASVCGLIWLAGVPRYVGTSGRIGFHAVYTRGERERDDPKVTGAGNALVGAYLTNLGMPYEVVLFATFAPPNSMMWLYPDDAEKLGIHVLALNDSEPDAREPGSFGFEPKPVVPSPEQGVTRLVLPAVPRLNPPAQQQPPVTMSYSAGQRARGEYERWVTWLPEGDFRSGVLFWSANRGNQPVPSCAPLGSSFDWRTGCAEARTRLFPSDIRGNKDNDFRLGWDSL